MLRGKGAAHLLQLAGGELLQGLQETFELRCGRVKLYRRKWEDYMTATSASPFVFISYSHDDQPHRARVLAFSERLRKDGCKTELDQYVNGSPREGWPRWTVQQMEKATHVLVVCTKKYGESFSGRRQSDVRGGLGGNWEGFHITQELYEKCSLNHKYIPVLFNVEDVEHIPGPLRSATYYVINNENTYKDLLDAINDNAGVKPGPVRTGPFPETPDGAVPEGELRAASTAISPVASAQEVPTTYIDHCVVNPAWLEAAARLKPVSFNWHPKITNVINLVAQHMNKLDHFAYQMYPTGSDDFIAGFKHRFIKDERRLSEAGSKVFAAWSALSARLPAMPNEFRSEALRTFAACASLWQVDLLQRFEGMLFTEDCRRVLRLYQDMPRLECCRLFWPSLPYRHAVNQLAFGDIAIQGMLLVRASSGNPSDWKYVGLPRYDAETWQDSRPGPLHLYHEWVIPQWLLWYQEPLPAENQWWISVLCDEEGRERYMKCLPIPWNDVQTSTELPERMRYTFQPERYEIALIMPPLHG